MRRQRPPFPCNRGSQEARAEEAPRFRRYPRRPHPARMPQLRALEEEVATTTELQEESKTPG